MSYNSDWIYCTNHASWCRVMNIGGWRRCVCGNGIIHRQQQKYSFAGEGRWMAAYEHKYKVWTQLPLFHRQALWYEHHLRRMVDTNDRSWDARTDRLKDRLDNDIYGDVMNSTQAGSFLCGWNCTKARGPFERELDQMPLAGYPGPLFYAIHIVSLVCLFTSAIVCFLLIVFLCLFRKSDDHGTSKCMKMENNNPMEMPNRFSPFRAKNKPGIPFWKWCTGERLVIYLALADLSYSITHTADKFYYVLAEANPPDLFCSAFGFLFQEFMFVQWIIVLFTAINACSLVVFNRKLNLGKWDWKLLAAAFGLPAVNGMVALSLGLLGQSGVW